MHIKRLLFGVVLFFSTAFNHNLAAQTIDRLTLGYDLMYIDRIHFKDGSSADVPGLYRNLLHVTAQKGPVQLGLVYQITRGEGFNAEAAEGLMLMGAYEHYLSYSFKARLEGRVGVSPGIDFGNILYATDTDVQLQIGYFNPDGHGFLRDYPLFPSGYTGVIVNRFGRVQAVAGIGTFWRGFNTYLTGFYAFNGITEVRMPPADQVDIAFGFLNNSGVSASLGYYIKDWIIGVRHNFPVFNSGNDWVFSIRHTFYYD
ncbi:MAG: hypothetical protein AAF385_03600 [Pseudomonadota bacterium]